MKGANIPQDVVKRVVARCGTEHPYAGKIDPRRTALLVIDLQNAFMRTEVGHINAASSGTVRIVPTVNRLADAVRQAGGGVFWIQGTHDERVLTDWSILYETGSAEAGKRRIAALSEGTHGHALWPDLDVRPEDEIVLKYRYSAFIQGASDLPERLKKRGFDTLLIAGTGTNNCCESSARDAMMLNYRVVMVSDANASITEAEHDAALVTFYLWFGDVMDSDLVIAELTRQKAQVA